MGGVLNSLVNFIFDRMHPIGSFYISEDDKDPETIFGGKWIKIRDKFLLSSGSKSVGTTGGEESHILTEKEMPEHSHPLREMGNTENIYTERKTFESSSATPQYTAYGRKLKVTESAYTTLAPNYAKDPWRLFAREVGGGEPHNNMPPYLVVNIWKRIA